MVHQYLSGRFLYTNRKFLNLPKMKYKLRREINEDKEKKRRDIDRKTFKKPTKGEIDISNLLEHDNVREEFIIEIIGRRNKVDLVTLQNLLFFSCLRDHSKLAVMLMKEYHQILSTRFVRRCHMKVLENAKRSISSCSKEEDNNRGKIGAILMKTAHTLSSFLFHPEFRKFVLSRHFNYVRVRPEEHMWMRWRFELEDVLIAESVLIAFPQDSTLGLWTILRSVSTFGNRIKPEIKQFALNSLTTFFQRLLLSNDRVSLVRFFRYLMYHGRFKNKVKNEVFELFYSEETSFEKKNLKLCGEEKIDHGLMVETIKRAFKRIFHRLLNHKDFFNHILGFLSLLKRIVPDLSKYLDFTFKMNNYELLRTAFCSILRRKKDNQLHKHIPYLFNELEEMSSSFKNGIMNNPYLVERIVSMFLKYEMTEDKIMKKCDFEYIYQKDREIIYFINKEFPKLHLLIPLIIRMDEEEDSYYNNNNIYNEETDLYFFFYEDPRNVILEYENKLNNIKKTLWEITKEEEEEEEEEEEDDDEEESRGSSGYYNNMIIRYKTGKKFPRHCLDFKRLNFRGLAELSLIIRNKCPSTINYYMFESFLFFLMNLHPKNNNNNKYMEKRKQVFEIVQKCINEQDFGGGDINNNIIRLILSSLIRLYSLGLNHRFVRRQVQISKEFSLDPSKLKEKEKKLPNHERFIYPLIDGLPNVEELIEKMRKDEREQQEYETMTIEKKSILQDEEEILERKLKNLRGLFKDAKNREELEWQRRLEIKQSEKRKERFEIERKRKEKQSEKRKERFEIERKRKEKKEEKRRRHEERMKEQKKAKEERIRKKKEEHENRMREQRERKEEQRRRRNQFQQQNNYRHNNNHRGGVTVERSRNYNQRTYNDYRNNNNNNNNNNNQYGNRRGYNRFDSDVRPHRIQFQPPQYYNYNNNNNNRNYRNYSNNEPRPPPQYHQGYQRMRNNYDTRIRDERNKNNEDRTSQGRYNHYDDRKKK